MGFVAFLAMRDGSGGAWARRVRSRPLRGFPLRRRHSGRALNSLSGLQAR